MDGAGTLLFTGTLKYGSASFSTSSLSKGIHSITVVYSGDTNYIGSSTSVLTQVVNR
jgi:hypothetical protein